MRHRLILAIPILALTMLAGCGSASTSDGGTYSNNTADAASPEGPANEADPTGTSSLELTELGDADTSAAEAVSLPSVVTSEQQAELADVISVEVSGEPQAYQFAVGISSPDTGCDQYADWWEVLSEEGDLLYRRVLLHSHANEQPFVRSGGPVEIAPDTVVWVRAHMHPDGYGGAAFRGSVQGGFEQADLSPDFAADVEEQEPLPESCAF